MKKILLASFVLAFSILGTAETLQKTLKLPDYLAKNYGDLDVKIKEGGSEASAKMTYKSRTIGAAGHGAKHSLRVTVAIGTGEYDNGGFHYSVSSYL